MAYGLRIRDEAGNVVLDMTDRVFRIRGYVVTGTANGAVNIAVSPGNALFVVSQVPNVNASAPGQANWFQYGPTFTISGGTVSWAFSGNGGNVNMAPVSVVAIIGEY
jgi:hypothetical protein